MPEDFLQCIREGGDVITISHGDSYTRSCKDKSGKWHAGETHKKKGKTGGRKKPSTRKRNGPKKTTTKRKPKKRRK